MAQAFPFTNLTFVANLLCPCQNPVTTFRGETATSLYRTAEQISCLQRCQSQQCTNYTTPSTGERAPGMVDLPY